MIYFFPAGEPAGTPRTGVKLNYNLIKIYFRAGPPLGGPGIIN